MGAARVLFFAGSVWHDSVLASMQGLCSIVQGSLHMGGGVTSGGGKCSLDYLFGIGEAPKAVASKLAANIVPVTAVRDVPSVSTEKPASQSVEARHSPAIPAGFNRPLNNYHHADGKNTGNFITAKVEASVDT